MAKQLSVNGRFYAEGEPCLRADDRGFRFGDGVFETIPVHGGTIYLWDYHLERLKAGCAMLRMKPPPENLLNDALRLLRQNAMTDAMLRISISRGAGSKGYLPLNPSPTVVIETLPRPPASASGSLYLSAWRRPGPLSLPTHCKLAQGLNSTLARLEAEGAGCMDALQLSEAGHLAEASSANLFWLKDGVLHTPSLETGALAGVTRRRMLELSPWPVREDLYPLTALEAAEAVFVTNATFGVRAILKLAPQGWQWNSHEAALRLNALRERDIALCAISLRE